MASATKVLVVDDDAAVLKAVSEVLRRDGFEVVAVGSPVEGLTLAKDPSFDVVVSDIKMPLLSGMDLLKALKQVQPDLEVVLMTGHGTIESAVQAVKAGAYHYLTKPFERLEDFTLTVTRAAERRALRKRATVLEAALTTRTEFEGMVGQSAQMAAVYQLVETVGPTNATLLIQGESGTGKELVARAVHYRSPRRERPFVAINCSALTDTLLESELFGYVKGAFTGAIGGKKGLFEAAHGGTIFLDEIGDMPLATQVKLLRTLQEGEIRRVGSPETITVDVRVIAATNVDLLKAKAQGRFREDLYYRLNVVGLRLPPLRERPEDVPLLAQHFLGAFAKQMNRKLEGFTPEAMRLLTLYNWVGNVRELENVVERAVVFAQGPLVVPENLPPELHESSKPSGNVDALGLAHLPFSQAKAISVSAFERQYLTQVLEKAGNNITQAALAAGMDRSNFRRLLKDHGLAGRAPEPGDAAE